MQSTVMATCVNATVFPHNIGLGAANNPELMEKIGRATAEEMLATGIPWNFAPVVAVVQDVRWGRTYEGYGERQRSSHRWAQLISKACKAVRMEMLLPLASPFLCWQLPNISSVMARPSGAHPARRITNWIRATCRSPKRLLRELYLPPYQSAVDAGAMNVMASFSSWKGTKMHAQQYLLTKVLKDELGFNGFIVSDWQAMDQIYPDDYYASVVTSINAGMDMNMVPYDYVTFIETMKQAVNNGDIPKSRVDEAVRRILRVKFALGLFEHPMPDTKYQGIGPFTRASRACAAGSSRVTGLAQK